MADSPPHPTPPTGGVARPSPASQLVPRAPSWPSPVTLAYIRRVSLVLGSPAKEKSLLWWVCTPISPEAGGPFTTKSAQLWEGPQPADSYLPSLLRDRDVPTGQRLTPEEGGRRAGRGRKRQGRPRVANQDRGIRAGLEAARGSS